MTDDASGQMLLKQQSIETVYVVATVYADDPHPHVEGVYQTESDAEDMMDKCRDKFTPPHPIAWQLIEETVQNSK